MANEGNPSHSRGIPLEQTPEMRRDKAIIELQDQARKVRKSIAPVNVALMVLMCTLPSICEHLKIIWRLKDASMKLNRYSKTPRSCPILV